MIIPSIRVAQKLTFFRISVHKPIEIAKMLNAYTQPSQLVADSKVKPADGTAQPQHRGLLQIAPRDYSPLASRRVTTVCGVQCVRAEHSLDPGPRALPTYIPTTACSNKQQQVWQYGMAFDDSKTITYSARAIWVVRVGSSQPATHIHTPARFNFLSNCRSSSNRCLHFRQQR